MASAGSCGRRAQMASLDPNCSNQVCNGTPDNCNNIFFALYEQNKLQGELKIMLSAALRRVNML